MPSWVMPAVAAELWGVPVGQVLADVEAGRIASRTEGEFLFVDVDPNGGGEVRQPDARPAAYRRSLAWTSPPTQPIITAAERDALAACLERPRRGSCDLAAARAARAKLKAAKRAQARDLSKLKDLLLTDLAAELGKPVAEVTTAIGASLRDALDQAVARGWLTAKGRELALQCFDAPASCDRKALRAEVTLPFPGGFGPGKRRG